MIELREEDIEDFELVVTSHSLNSNIQLKMKNLCSYYKLGNCNFCGTCDEQVGRVWRNIKEYYEKNK